MNLGLNLFSVRGLIGTEEDFRRTALALKEQGYTYLQYSGGPYDAEMIRRVSLDTGMPVVLTHVPLARIVNETQKLMEEHASFGCKNIGLGMMPTDVIRDEKTCKETVASLDRAGEEMQKAGFHFFYHHHHFEFFKHGGQTVFDYMIENAPHINFTVDTYWLQYGGADILATLKKLTGRMGCVHLKDYMIEEYEENGAQFRPVFAPLGEGTLDFPAIAAAMKRGGAKYFLVEQDNATTKNDPLGETKRSANYAKRFLREIL